jgi:1,2-phenylacetyl-CoA epoxidase PaaB subunit
MQFDVFDNDFKKVGTVEADDAASALQKAKNKFKFIAAPMVQETNEHKHQGE